MEDTDNNVEALSEDDFLSRGEPDPEFENILHLDYRVFDFVTKEQSHITDEEFFDSHQIVDLGEETNQAILSNMKRLMKEKGNSNV